MMVVYIYNMHKMLLVCIEFGDHNLQLLLERHCMSYPHHYSRNGNHHNKHYYWRRNSAQARNPFCSFFLGCSYVILFLFGKGGHIYSHNKPTKKMGVAGLDLIPALSPCATTLPMFLAVGNSSSLMVPSIIVLFISTITVVAFSFYGASRLRLHWAERYDKLLVGSVLCLVGFFTLIFHDHDGDVSSSGEHLHRKLIIL